MCRFDATCLAPLTFASNTDRPSSFGTMASVMSPLLSTTAPPVSAPPLPPPVGALPPPALAPLEHALVTSATAATIPAATTVPLPAFLRVDITDLLGVRDIDGPARSLAIEQRTQRAARGCA